MCNAVNTYVFSIIIIFFFPLLYAKFIHTVDTESKQAKKNTESKLAPLPGLPPFDTISYWFKFGCECVGVAFRPLIQLLASLTKTFVKH